MGLDRSNNLARLSIESDIAKQIDVDNVILSFAKKKACNPVLVKLVSFLIFLSNYIFSADCGIHEAVSIQVIYMIYIYIYMIYIYIYDSI